MLNKGSKALPVPGSPGVSPAPNLFYIKRVQVISRHNSRTLQNNIYIYIISYHMNIVLSTYLCILILYNDVPYLYIVILVDSLHMWVQTGAAAIRCAHPSLKDPHSYALMSIISNYIPLVYIIIYIYPIETP